MKTSIRWPAFVVGILATHTGLMILAVMLFVRHHDAGIIPDYYDKAVHWDQNRAAHPQPAGSNNEAMP